MVCATAAKPCKQLKIWHSRGMKRPSHLTKRLAQHIVCDRSAKSLLNTGGRRRREIESKLGAAMLLELNGKKSIGVSIKTPIIIGKTVASKGARPIKACGKKHRKQMRLQRHLQLLSWCVHIGGLTSKAQARGTKGPEPRSGTGCAIPRCLQREPV